MTPYTLGLQLLKYVGITSYDPAINANNLNAPTIGVTDPDDVASCINQALQEFFSLAPSEYISRRMGFVLHAPSADPVLTCTKYSEAITMTGFLPWMEGCAILINGDAHYNRIITPTLLERPYMGTTGSGKSSTVYGDAIRLPNTIAGVTEPVELVDVRTLLPAPDSITFETIVNANESYVQPAPLPLVQQMYSYTRNKTIASPLIWAAYAMQEGGDGFGTINMGRKLLLRVYPYPDTDYPLTARVEFGAYPIKVSDLYTGIAYNVDPWKEAGKSLNVPDSIIAPLAAFRWTAHPAFKNAGAKQSIGQQYKLALGMIDDLRPQVSFQRFRGVR
jgi:hypothetical protein